MDYSTFTIFCQKILGKHLNLRRQYNVFINFIVDYQYLVLTEFYPQNEKYMDCQFTVLDGTYNYRRFKSNNLKETLKYLDFLFLLEQHLFNFLKTK